MRLTPTFPMSNNGNPEHISDDQIHLERSSQLSGDYSNFKADNIDTAIYIVLEDFIKRLEHTTCKKGHISNKSS